MSLGHHRAIGGVCPIACEVESAMKAVALTQYLPIDDPRSLFDIDLPQPSPTGHDLLVRVEAVSVNPVDTKIRGAEGHR
jgi:NADPH:quinone reductase-like Zn-dependent oxidoreductase